MPPASPPASPPAAPAAVPEHAEIAAARARVAELDAATAAAWTKASADPRVPYAAQLAYAALVAWYASGGSPWPLWASATQAVRQELTADATMALLGFSAAGMEASKGGSAAGVLRFQKTDGKGAMSDGYTATKAGRRHTLVLEACRWYFEETADHHDWAAATSAGATPAQLAATLAEGIATLTSVPDLLATAKLPHATAFKATAQQMAAAQAKLAKGDGAGAREALSVDEPGWPTNIARSVVHAIRGDLAEVGVDPGPRRHMGVSPTPATPAGSKS